MASKRLAIFTLAMLAGCGGGGSRPCAADSLSRDLQRLPVDSSATFARHGHPGGGRSRSRLQSRRQAAAQAEAEARRAEAGARPRACAEAGRHGHRAGHRDRRRDQLEGEQGG